jgi:hypothetical protein
MSYRKLEVFLIDSPDWCADIGMNGVPDHNTLWRAFGRLIKAGRMNRAFDLLAKLQSKRLARELKKHPLTMDSTCFEPRHSSKHYDRVCRKMELRPGEKYGKTPEKQARYDANVARSRAVKQLPKLSMAVSASSGHVLAVRCRIGNRSDAPDFGPLLYDAWRRAPVRTVVADSGYDSEANHRTARLDMGVRSIIPTRRRCLRVRRSGGLPRNRRAVTIERS